MELSRIFEQYFKPCSYEQEKENIEVCKRCGGGCCKAMGCHISPFDLKTISIESIISLIEESGCISIDWWEGDPVNKVQDGSRVYYLRIKNSNSEVVDPSFGGKCSILTDTGCPIPFEYRPKGARDLIPCDGEQECYVVYSKEQCAIDWYDYQDIMEKVYKCFNHDEEINPCNLFDIFERTVLRMEL